MVVGTRSNTHVYNGGVPDPDSRSMSDTTLATGGFVERIQNEATTEANAVLEELKGLRFRADQVAHVLRALNLPIPGDLRALMSEEAVPEPAPQPPPQPAPVVPKPAPEAPPTRTRMASRSQIESNIRAIAEGMAGQIIPRRALLASRVNASVTTVGSILERLATAGWLERVGDEYRRPVTVEPEPEPPEPEPEAPAPAPAPEPEPATPEPAAPAEDLPPQARVVLGLFNDQPSGTRLGVAEVGAKLDTHPESVRKSLELLSTRGYLRKRPRPGGVRGFDYALPELPSGPGTPPRPEPEPSAPPAREREPATKKPARPRPGPGDPTTIQVEGGRLDWDPNALGGQGKWLYVHDPAYAPHVLGREKDMLALFELVKSHPRRDYTAREAAHEIGIERSKANGLMREGESRGFLYIKSRRRSNVPGMTDKEKRGRFSDAYAWVPNSLFTSTSKLEGFERYPRPGEVEQPPRPKGALDQPKQHERKQPEKAAAKPKSDTRTQQELLNELRTVMRHVTPGESVSAQWLADEMKAPLATVVKLLETLVGSSGGSVKATGDGPQRRYTFQRSSDPGAAAKVDAQRRRTGGRNPQEGSLPVPGTGRGPKAAHAEVQTLLNAVAKLVGRENISQSGGHWAIKCPNGARVMISSTPSDRRSLLADRARLRRIGNLDLP